MSRARPKTYRCDGHTRTAAQWARALDPILGITARLITERVAQGWTVARSLTTPARVMGDAKRDYEMRLVARADQRAAARLAEERLALGPLGRSGEHTIPSAKLDYAAPENERLDAQITALEQAAARALEVAQLVERVAKREAVLAFIRDRRGGRAA